MQEEYNFQYSMLNVQFILRKKEYLNIEHEQYAYLGFMYVKPSQRGKGVNKIIIESLKKWAASKNIKEIRLEVYQNNETAINAYQKAGFSGHIVEMRMGIQADY